MIKPHMYLIMPEDNDKEITVDHETVGEVIELLRKHYPAAIVTEITALNDCVFYRIHRDRFALRSGNDRAAESGFAEFLKETMPESATITMSSGSVGKAVMPSENAAEFEAAFADNWHGMRPQKNESED